MVRGSHTAATSLASRQQNEYESLESPARISQWNDKLCDDENISIPG